MVARDGENVLIFHLKKSEARHGFVEEMVRIHEKVKQSKMPNFQGIRIPVLSNINVEFLDNDSKNYHDKAIVDLMRFRAPISFIGEKSGVNICINHIGSRLYPKEIDSYVTKELGYNTVLGPSISNPFKSEITISPPKPDSIERRVIVDLSFPEGNSVNSGIHKDLYLGEDIRLRFPKWIIW